MDLVVMHDKESVTTSLNVARDFKKNHYDVLDSINNLVRENPRAKKYFAKGTYRIRGREYPMFYMKRGGFSLVAMGFSGKEATKFKLDYIEAFDRMEQALLIGKRPRPRTVDLEVEIDHIEAFNDKPIRVVAYRGVPAYGFLDLQRALGYRKTASRLWRGQKPMKLVQIKNSGQYNGRVLVATMDDLQELTTFHQSITPQLVALKKFIKVQKPRLLLPAMVEQLALPIDSLMAN